MAAVLAEWKKFASPLGAVKAEFQSAKSSK
jgi:hypothetical protein